MANTNHDRKRFNPNSEHNGSGYQPHDQLANTPGETHGRPVTREEVAYRNGYTEAQLRDQHRLARQHDRRANEGDRTATGVILGILLTAAVGLIAGAFYWASQNNNDTVVPAVEGQPTISPQITTEDSDPAVIERNTTVIERSTDRVQESTPAQPPEVQINVPSPSTNNSAPAQNNAAPTQDNATSPGTTSAPQQNSAPQINLEQNEAAPSGAGTAPQSGTTGSNGAAPGTTSGAAPGNTGTAQ